MEGNFFYNNLIISQMLKKLIPILALLLSTLFPLRAAYLENVPQTLIQPNGDTLHCFATGDEYYHYLHDAEGYTIVLDPATGYFVYADKIEGQLVPTSFIPDRVNPASVGLVPYLNISADEWLAKRRARESAGQTRSRTRSDYSQLNHGTINNIVVFIRFAGESNFTNNAGVVNRMFNDSTGNYQSMKSYFRSATYNQLTINSYFYPAPSGSTILSYQDENPRGYYQPYSSTNTIGYQDGEQASREHPLLQRAINYIESMVPADLDIDNDNDGYVDNVVFVIRGNVGDWNDLLWPHKWTLFTQSAAAYIHGKRVLEYNIQLADNSYYFSVSTLCHEMNHTLGAPDLYHYYNGTSLSPVGSWDLMQNNARPPQHMGAYMKYEYGTWLDSIPEITQCGTYTLHALGTSATNNCYKIAGPNEHEYFVLEYRNNQSDYYETSLPSSGLLIYRINDRFWGNSSYDGTTNFDEIYLYRRNGTPNSDGDVDNAAFGSNLGRSAFNSETNPRPFLTDGTYFDDLYIHQISSAGGDSISFTYCAENYIGVTADLVELSADSNSTGTFRVNSDLSWYITCDCDWVTVSPLSDSGTVVINVVANDYNNSVDPRECVLTITASNGQTRTVVIRQLGVQPLLLVTVDDNTFDSDVMDTLPVYVTSNMDWTVNIAVPWLSYYGATGLHTDTTARYYFDTLYFYTTEGNTSCVQRMAAVNFLGLNEAATAATTSLYQSGVSSTLTATPAAVTIPNSPNATATAQIHSNTSWTVTSNATWLTVSPMSGTNDQQLTFTATMTNSSTNPKTAIIQISNSCGDFINLNVTQPAGSFNVVENEVTLAAASGSTSTVHVNCTGTWHVIAGTVPNWLQLTPESDEYDGTFTVTALLANEEDQPRTASLRFAYGLNFRDTLVVTQLTSVGIDENVPENFTFFPNPVENVLNITAETAYQYVVVDALGKEVANGEIVAGNNAVRFNNLSSGVYFVRLTNLENGKTITHKVVKK